MTEYNVNERDMKLLSNSKLIMQEWYLFLKAIDTIQHPNNNTPYAPFRDIWSSRTDYKEVKRGKFEVPAHQTEDLHSANRPGGTGEMYYFALELQRFVEDVYHNHPSEMMDMEGLEELAAREHPSMVLKKPKLLLQEGDSEQTLIQKGFYPMLWDRPGWYVEVVKTRRPQEEIDMNDVPPWPHIILGYASNAGLPSLQPEWTRKRPDNDFCSVHVISFEYKEDQDMAYRLMWEQTGYDADGQKTAEEYEESWAIPTDNNDTSDPFIPITRPIAYLFKPRAYRQLLNYPFQVAIGEPYGR